MHKFFLMVQPNEIETQDGIVALDHLLRVQFRAGEMMVQHLEIVWTITDRSITGGAKNDAASLRCQGIKADLPDFSSDGFQNDVQGAFAQRLLQIVRKISAADDPAIVRFLL